VEVSTALREKIARAMKRLYDRGLISSVGGNISCRVGGRLFITPSGKPKPELESWELVEVDLSTGSTVGGIPSSELPVHMEIYKKRRDAGCIVHAHPPYTVLLATIFGGELLERVRLTPEAALYAGRVAVVGYVTPGAKASLIVGEAAAGADAVVVKKHGVFSIGKTLEEALARVEVLEENSKLLYYSALIVCKGAPDCVGAISSLSLSESEVAELLESYKKLP